MINFKIRALRRERDITQQELAEKSTVNRKIIHELETGKRQNTKTETLHRIANVLQVDITELFDKGE